MHDGFNKNSNETNKVLKGNSLIKIIIVFVMVITFCLGGYSLAKYIQENKDENNSFVSSFVIGANYQSSDTVLLGSIRPGESIDVTLKVSNFDGDDVSEVDLSYSFAIETKHNLPLDITITASEENSSYASFSYGTTWENGKMKALEKSLHEYVINIYWDCQNNDIKYADEVDMLKITLNAEQVL